MRLECAVLLLSLVLNFDGRAVLPRLFVGAFLVEHSEDFLVRQFGIESLFEVWVLVEAPQLLVDLGHEGTAIGFV